MVVCKCLIFFQNIQYYIYYYIILKHILNMYFYHFVSTFLFS